MKQIIRFICEFLLVISLLCVILIFNISNFASTKSLQKNFENLDLVTEVKKIKNSGNASNQGEISRTISDIYNLAARLSIPADFVDQIINSKAMKETLGSVVGNITDYVVNDVSSPLITEQEINKIIDDNIDKWVSDSKVEMSETTKKRLVAGMKELVPTLISIMPTSDDILESDYHAQVELIQIVFSNESKILLCVISGVLILFIILLSLNKNKWFLSLGIPFLLTGFITIIGSLFLPDILISLFSQDVYSVVLMALNFITCPLILSGSLFVLIAIVLFFVYYLKVSRN